MATKTKLVKLVGGTHDGETVEVYSYQPLIYLAKRISMEEAADLDIDGTTAWKFPEEVYEKQLPSGDFVYRNTVNYKPETKNGN